MVGFYFARCFRYTEVAWPYRSCVAVARCGEYIVVHMYLFFITVRFARFKNPDSDASFTKKHCNSDIYVFIIIEI